MKCPWQRKPSRQDQRRLRTYTSYRSSTQLPPERDFERLKVGITKDDVEERIGGLQTGNPYRLRCEASFESPVARHIENWVHRTNAARLVQPEWLRLVRSDIPHLVEAARQEGERFGHIARAKARWSQSTSNGEKRPPTDQERQLHAAVQDLFSRSCPVKLRLRHAEASIALRAGLVSRIPGILRIKLTAPSRRFSSKMALHRFPDLAAGHMVEKIERKFCWLNVPNLGSTAWRDLRLEVEGLERHERHVHELTVAMLRSQAWLSDTGERTDDLARCHENYLRLKEQEPGLKGEEEELQAQMIQLMKTFEAISGICSFRRVLKAILNNDSFQEAHPPEAAECYEERPAAIRRTIYPCRSY